MIDQLLPHQQPRLNAPHGWLAVSLHLLLHLLFLSAFIFAGELNH